jgi:hypothetical protein
VRCVLALPVIKTLVTKASCYVTKETLATYFQPSIIYCSYCLILLVLIAIILFVSFESDH